MYAKLEPTSSQTARFLVLGDSQSGKTSIINYFCNPESPYQKISPTIGCDVHVKEFQTSNDDEKSYQYAEFWDLNIEKTPTAIIQAYLQSLIREIESVKGILLLFDISNIKSFLRIRRYLEDIVVPFLEQKRAVLASDTEVKAIPVLIIGTKGDMVDDDITAKKKAFIEEDMKLIYGENSKNLCDVLSIYYEYAQFEGMEGFVKACMKGEGTEIYMYGGFQEDNSNDRLSYTKKKLLSFGKDIVRMKDYLMAQRSGLSSLFMSLRTASNNFDVKGLIWRH